MLVWSLRTDTCTWTTCLDATTADVLPGLKRKTEETQLGHVWLLPHQTWRSVMLNISLSQSSSGKTLKGLPGQMAVKDAFNQELYRSRTNGGHGLVGHCQSNCYSWSSCSDTAWCSTVAESFSQRSQDRKSFVTWPEGQSYSQHNNSCWQRFIPKLLSATHSVADCV